MTDSNPKSDDVDDNGRTGTVSRRRALKSGLSTAGALVFAGGAVGSAAASQETGRFNDAPGRGGEAVVPHDDFSENATFRIIERAGDPPRRIEGVSFECNEGDGKSIFLVGWHFRYAGEDEIRTLYTRSNNIDTERTFSWGGNGHKRCEGSGATVTVEGGTVVSSGERADYVQTPYGATGQQKD